MKVSKIGLISKKLENINEQFPVQDMLIQTGQISQFGSGVYAYGHIPYLVEKNIRQVISDTLTKFGACEVLLPLLQPEYMWIESGRLQKYVDDKVMFRVLSKNGNFCMAPTAEEAVVAFVKDRLNSHKQLPFTFFQIGTKFRDEIRCRGFMLRGKEFQMLDAYSFGRDNNDLEAEYENIKLAYAEIFKTLGLKVQPVGADNGGMGGSKSEEYMCISSVGEDNVLFDEISGKAFNSELLDREDAEEYLKTTYGISDISNLKAQKAVELGHVFQLGDKYSSTMGLTFTDKDGKEQLVQMGCYGIGVSRTLAMLYENSLIDKESKSFEGISLPLSVAPYVLYIVVKTDDVEILSKATDIYDKLDASGVKVLFDDRNEISIGAKVKDCLVTGTPYVAIFGNSLKNGNIEVENTRTKEKFAFDENSFIETMIKLQSLKASKSLEEIVK